MKSYRKELWFNILSHRSFVNITTQVEEALRESGIKDGLILVNASLLHPHYQNHHISQSLAVCVSLQKFDQPNFQF